jgi:glycosyltransferase involved in cell wall biosynthesis
MFVWHLGRLHDRERLDFRVLSLGALGALGPRFAELGIPAASLDCDGRGRSSTLLRVVAALRPLQPDVLHTHNPNPHLYGSAAAQLLGVPVVVHTKHGRNRPAHRPAVLVNRLASCLTDCVVAVSHDAADVAREVERVPRRKLRVIHNGIDVPAGAPQRRPAAGAVLRAVHVARLNPIKDQDTLLRAVRRVVDAEPRFELDVIGDGPRREELLALRSELRLTGHVRFLGYRDDVPELLTGRGLFLLSSLSEGISLTLLEAMAAGLPVVATAVGGNPEVVVPGQTGLLVPPRDPDRLAAAILSLIRDPRQAADLGRAGRERVAAHFDLRRVVAAYQRLYEELLIGKDVHARRSPRTAAA